MVEKITMGARITHISYQLGAKKFSEADFFSLFPESKDNTTLKKAGIVDRYVVAEGETASDLAVKAAEKLLAETGIDRSSIDFLLYVSADFDYYTPATSIAIHGRLGLSLRCGTLDQTHGCSAYVYGLSTAKGLILQGICKNVLVLTANTLTRYLHEKDRASRFLFGDAAAATLVTASDTDGIGHIVLGTDPGGLEKIIVRDGADRHPINEASYHEITDGYGNVTDRASLYMDGIGVFLLSVHHVPQLVKDTLERNNLAMNDIDLFVFHQANYYMIETIVKKLGIPPDKVFNNASHIGNTIGSSIPIALAGALAQQKAVKGSKVLLAGFGTGFSLSATVITV